MGFWLNDYALPVTDDSKNLFAGGEVPMLTKPPGPSTGEQYVGEKVKELSDWVKERDTEAAQHLALLDKAVQEKSLGGPVSMKLSLDMADRMNPTGMGVIKPKSFLAYRGSAPGNVESSSMNKDLVFMSTNKEAAAQYGDVAEHKLRGDLKMLNLSSDNPEARRVLFHTTDKEILQDLGIKSADDLKDEELFGELFGEGASENSIGMLPGKNAPAIIKALGYDGVKWGDDFWLAGNVSDYAVKPPSKIAQEELKKQKQIQKEFKVLSDADEEAKRKALEVYYPKIQPTPKLTQEQVDTKLAEKEHMTLEEYLKKKRGQ